MKWPLVAGMLLITSAAFAGDFDNPSDAPQMALEHCRPLDLPDAVHWCMSMDGFDFLCRKKTRANVLNWRCWRFDPESTHD